MSKNTKHKKKPKKKKVIYGQEKKSWIETDLRMTQMLDVADKYLKVFI